MTALSINELGIDAIICAIIVPSASGLAANALLMLFSTSSLVKTIIIHTSSLT